MCTLTWARTADGYELFFNRDELKTRRPALPPEQRETGGVRWAAAIDADAGGTWLGVNAHGLTIGLLNGWRGRDQEQVGATSRGLLVTGLLDAECADEVERRLAARDLREFRSFNLLAFEPAEFARGASRSTSKGVLRASWDGEQLVLERAADEHQPISSSSRDPEGAERNRRAVWRALAGEGLPGPAALAAFHASHDPEPGAWSPCMHRDDAETVSFTHIRVEPSRVQLSYQPGAPCRAAPAVTVELARAGSSWSCSNR